MNNRKIVLTAFILVVLAQLYVPARMIFNRELIITKGKEFKFRAAPVDPNDPFRGKYITLNYRESSFTVKDTEEWKEVKTIYVLLSKDTNGYATARSISKTKPAGTQDFVKANISYVSNDTVNNLFVSYPFDRFYMEESKAYDAEVAYRESAVDTSQVTYSLVNIKDGEAVLKDVLIGGVSVNEVVRNRAKSNR